MARHPAAKGSRTAPCRKRATASPDLRDEEAAATQYVYGTAGASVAYRQAAPASSAAAAPVGGAYGQKTAASYGQQQYAQTAYDLQAAVAAQQHQQQQQQVVYGGGISDAAYGGVSAAAAQQPAAAWQSAAGGHTGTQAKAQYSGAYGAYGTAQQAGQQQSQGYANYAAQPAVAQTARTGYGQAPSSDVLSAAARTARSPEYASAAGAAAYGQGSAQAALTGYSSSAAGYNADMPKYQKTAADYNSVKAAPYGSVTPPPQYAARLSAEPAYGSAYGSTASDFRTQPPQASDYASYGPSKDVRLGAARQYQDGQAAAAAVARANSFYIYVVYPCAHWWTLVDVFDQEQQDHLVQQYARQQQQALQQVQTLAQVAQAAAAQGRAAVVDSGPRGQLSGAYGGGMNSKPDVGLGRSSTSAVAYGGGYGRGGTSVAPGFGGARGSADSLAGQGGSFGATSPQSAQYAAALPRQAAASGFSAQQPAFAPGPGAHAAGSYQAQHGTGFSQPGRGGFGGGRGMGGGGPPGRAIGGEFPFAGHQRETGFSRAPVAGPSGRYDFERRERRFDGEREREKYDDRRPVRDRDRDRDRRVDDDRKRESSRREERDDRLSRHKHASPAKDVRKSYVCKVDPFSFVEAERDFQSITRRYTRLHMMPEFSRLVACWVANKDMISISNPISFEHDIVDIEDETAAMETSAKPTPSPRTVGKSSVYNVKVMLMTGADRAALEELLVEAKTLNDGKPMHLHNLVKFVTVRKDRNAIMPVGGSWDADLDGGDPSTDEALIRTAIRCTKELVHLDLSGCRQWTRFIEVHYERSAGDNLASHHEVTIFFLPSIHDIVPSLEEWKSVWKSHQQQVKKSKENATLDKSKPASDKAGQQEKMNMPKEEEEKKDMPKEEEEKVEEGSIEQPHQAPAAEVAPQGGQEMQDTAELQPASDVLLGEEAGNRAGDEATTDGQQEEVKLEGDDETSKGQPMEELKDVEIAPSEEQVHAESTVEAPQESGLKPMEVDVQKEEASAVLKETDPMEEVKEEPKKDNIASEHVKEESKEEPSKEPEVGEMEAGMDQPALLLITERSKQAKWKSVSISLDGLLDYDEEDKEECTFELSLFAESFKEMLQCRYGCQILGALEALWVQSYGRKKEEKKRARSEGEKKDNGKEEPAVKKQEVEKEAEKEVKKEEPAEQTDEPLQKEGNDVADNGETSTGNPPPATENGDAGQHTTDEAEVPEHKVTAEEGGVEESAAHTGEEPPKQEQGQAEPQTPLQDMVKEVKQESEAAAKPNDVSVREDEDYQSEIEDAREAFRYFDRNRTDTLKARHCLPAEDARCILHNLGKYLTSKAVKDLVACATSETAGKSRAEAILYQNIGKKQPGGESK
eukprot:SM000037S13490  [mRNA]  locus=s37:177551:185876:+ [translate_table: standard]